MPESQSRRDEAFEQWFMRVYIERGYVSSKEELREAWKEALRHIASEKEARAPAGDAAETIEHNPKSLVAWKRRAEQLMSDAAEAKSSAENWQEEARRYCNNAEYWRAIAEHAAHNPQSAIRFSAEALELAEVWKKWQMSDGVGTMARDILRVHAELNAAPQAPQQEGKPGVMESGTGGRPKDRNESGSDTGPAGAAPVVPSSEWQPCVKCFTPEACREGSPCAFGRQENIPSSVRDIPTAPDPVYLCRASGEGSHNFRVATDEAGVFAFYDEMCGRDMDGTLDSIERAFRDPDEWSNDGTELSMDLYMAQFEVWKVDPREIVIPSAIQEKK